MRICPGQPYPLGATWDGAASISPCFRKTHRVELCLFDSADATAESHRIRIPEQTDQVWHVYLPEVQPGSTLRLSRSRSVRAARMAIDSIRTKSCSIPTPRRSAATCTMGRLAVRLQDRRPDARTNRLDDARQRRVRAAWPPWSIQPSPGATIGRRERPGTRRSSTKCTSKASPSSCRDVPEKLRGTYAGLASEPAIQHLKSLTSPPSNSCRSIITSTTGIFVDEGLVQLLGLQHARLFCARIRLRFARIARASRPAIQDDGPSAARRRHRSDPRRGLQPHRRRQPTRARRCRSAASTTPRYYRLSPEDPRYYMDFTGCGNTLNMAHPRVLQLIMDSLRYWVIEMHVDGFRFDLASTLARELHEVNKLGAFFDIIHQDPVLSQVKLIAEPWDLGEGGYQVGNFPVLWTEWNGKYRDTRPPLLERRRRHGLRIRHATERQQRSVRAERPPAVRQHQLHHLPRRLHAPRPRQLQRKTQRGQRRRQSRRRQRQQQLELRRRRADRRSGDPSSCATAKTQSSRDADLLPGRADALAAATKSATPSTATTTPTARTTNSPGSTGTSTREQQEFLDFVRQSHRTLVHATGLPAPSLLSGPRHSRLRNQGHFVVDPPATRCPTKRGSADFVRCLGMRLAGDLIGDLDTNGANRSSATRSCSCSTPITRQSPSIFRRRRRNINGSEFWTRPIQPATCHCLRPTLFIHCRPVRSASGAQGEVWSRIRQPMRIEKAQTLAPKRPSARRREPDCERTSGNQAVARRNPH